jgi:hypothetical protein
MTIGAAYQLRDSKVPGGMNRVNENKVERGERVLK